MTEGGGPGLNDLGLKVAQPDASSQQPELQTRELPPLSEIDMTQIEDAARGSGDIIRDYYKNRRETKVGRKSERQAITDADDASQKHLKEKLLAIHDCSFLGEEPDPEDPRVVHEAILEGDQWVIDPVDGTENLHGSPPMIGVSIGLMRNGEPVLGVIYDPIHDVMYTARKGDDGIKVKEGTGEEQTLKISDCEDPTQAIVGLDFSSNMESRVTSMVTMGKVMETTRAVKIIGAPVLSLAAVASGDLELFSRPTTKLPDVIAGVTLVRAAGGRVVNNKGEDWTVGDKGEIIAGSPKMVEAFLPCFTPEPPTLQQLAG